MKRILVVLVVAALALVGFAPAASAKANGPAKADRCERLDKIEDRFERKAERAAKQTERMEARIERATDRLAEIDPADEAKIAKVERHIARLEAKVARHEAKLARLEARLAALVEACSAS